MAKRRKRSRKKNPATPRKRRSHRRKRNPSMSAAPKRRHHRRRARRRNPGFPPFVKTATAVGIGAIGGLAASFAVDKLNVGQPQPRNLGIIALGVAAAMIGGKMKKPMAGALVGAGIAGVGLTRLVATHQLGTAVPMSAAMHGLGTGDGLDMAGPFDRALGDRSIGLVTPGIGSVYDDVGISDVEGVYDIGLVTSSY